MSPLVAVAKSGVYQTAYSITSSAVASKLAGTVTWIA
jgi:hypothetical protein